MIHIPTGADMIINPQAWLSWNPDDRTEGVIDAREAGPAAGFTMRLVAVYTLPRREPANRCYWTRQNGRFSLTMSAAGEGGLPYGSVARLLLAWTWAEVSRTRSAQLRLEPSLSEFMRMVGVNMRNDGDERYGFYDQLDRLFSTVLSLNYKGMHGELMHERSERGEIASYLCLRNEQGSSEKPVVSEDPVLGDLTDFLGVSDSQNESTVVLGRRLANEIIARPVQIDTSVLGAVKDSALGLDVYLWLICRLAALDGPLRQTWLQLHRQFNHEPDKADGWNIDQCRTDILHELTKIRAAWPQLRYDVQRDYLSLHPSPSRLEVN